MEYVLLDGLLFKINKVTDLEGSLKKMPDKNTEATYNVEWSGNKGEISYFINQDSEQEHYGMKTSRVADMMLADNLLTVETLNSFYYLDLIGYDEKLDESMKQERKRFSD